MNDAFDRWYSESDGLDADWCDAVDEPTGEPSIHEMTLREALLSDAGRV